MLKFVLLALVATSAFAGFSIDLQAQRINDDQFVRYTQGSGQQSHLVSSAAASQQNAEQIYTFSPKVSGTEGEQRVVFDTTTGRNWQFDTVATPKSVGSHTVAAANGRATIVKANEAKVNVEHSNLNLKNVDVLKSNQLNDKDNKEIFNAATLGFSLNRDSATNFFRNLEENKVKIEENGKGFFFHLSDKVNQIFFGLPNTFFAKDKLEKINAKNAVDNNRWTIPVTSSGISLEGQDPLSYRDPVYATFDSTTQYIWAADDLVSSIVSSLNSKGFNCASADPNHDIGLYECETGNFPALNIQFNTNDSRFGEKTRTYKLTHYTEAVGNNKVRLLIRKSAQYKNSTQDSRVPSTSLNASTNDLVLGTVFFKNVFTYFNTEDHSVSLSQAFDVKPEGLWLDNTWRYWFLILGGILTLACLGALLAMITKVPYTKQQQASLPAAASTIAPQSYIVSSQAPAQPLYQTQYYVQQQQPVQLSPTRIVQTNLPQTYVQQQTGAQF